MITINCKRSNIDGTGVCRVLFHGELICKFEHNSSEDLSECLQKAADAVKINDWAESELMNDPKGG